MKHFFGILIFSFIFSVSYGQNQQSLTENKTSRVYDTGVAYLTVSSVLLLNTVSLNAELSLLKSSKTQLNLCGTFGLLSAPDFDGESIDASYIGLSPVLLFGPNRHFLELKAGAHYFSSDESITYNGVLASGAIAYRYYAMSNFMLRAGVGFPDIVQASVGFRF